MTKKHTVVLVDMDDTIENLLEAWLDALNERFHRFVTPDDIHSWDMREAYPGLSAEQVYAPLLTDELWRNVRPKWDAVFYMHELQDEGFEIYITTSSNLKTIFTKFEAVLARYFPFIPMDHVIVCSNKQMIRGDIMVDDAPHNLECGAYEKILMSAPHNKRYDAEANGMCRVYRWSQVYDQIHRITDGVSV